MSNFIKSLAKIPIYPFLFSIYPSLALVATNIREVDVSVVIRPMLLSLLAAVIISTVVFLIVKDKIKASLFTAVIVIWLLTYGHIVRILVSKVSEDHQKATEAISYLAAIGIAALILYLIANTRKNLKAWVKSFSAMSILLVSFPVMQISFATIASSNTSVPTSGVNTHAPEQNNASDANLLTQSPDIYYIILDGYSRADTLEALGFDNSEFLRRLEDKGFYVATCSTSNYRATALSMPAALNMDYLWNSIPNSGDKDLSVEPLYNSLVNNRVRNELDQIGYKIISFQTGYQWDEWTNADLYITPNNKYTTDQINFSSITPFEYIYLRNTALYPLLDGGRFATQRYYKHYNRVIFTLEELPNVALIPGPKFVYAHIMAPHHPFIFLPDGSLNTDSHYYDLEKGYPSRPELFNLGYLNNIQFLNSRIPDVVNKIIENSESPPVIILQGDHGFVIPERRFNIFNAYFLPGQEYDGLLYPSISPVNTFRIIFNQYFDRNMEILPDLTISADIGGPYRKGRAKPFPENCP